MEARALALSRDLHICFNGRRVLMNTSRASDKYLHYRAHVQPHGHTYRNDNTKAILFFNHCKATATLVQLGRRLFLQHSTAYRSSPEQLNEYFKTVLHN